MRKWWLGRLGAVVGLAVAAASPSVYAQDSEAESGSDESGGDAEARPPSPAAATPPDVVITKSGAMVRGTISEMDPDGEVVIQTLTGDLRRFSMSEVRFAGPAANMPEGTDEPVAGAQGNEKKKKKKKAKRRKMAPVIRVEAGEAELRLVANQPDVTFHLKTGSANFSGHGTAWGSDGPSTVSVSGSTHAYSTICTAPCESWLPTGSHRLALSLGGGAAVEVEESLHLRGPAKLEGKYTSNKGTRIFGHVLGIGSLVVALTLVATDDHEDDDNTQFYAAAGVLTVGTVAWVVLGFMPDDAEIRVVPEDAARTKRRLELAKRARSAVAVRVTPAGLVF